MSGSRRSGLVAAVAIRASVVFYRLLVRMRYSRELHGRFGEQMVADYRTWLREERAERGLAGVLDVTARAIRDLSRPLPTGPAAVRDPRGARPGSRGSGAGTWRPEALAEDVGFAARSLRREPRFAVLVIGVLGVGIGLNVLAFSIVNAYLVRPLPFPESERLVGVNTWGAVSWTEVSDLFELAISWDLDAWTITDGGRPELVRGSWITRDYLEAYDVRPALGRSFTVDEAGPGGSNVALISDGLWRRRFAADPGIVGRTFTAYMSDRPDETEAFTIVGVLPADFWYPNEYTDVLVPLRGDRPMYTGRLRPGVTIEEARAFLARLAEGRIENAPPDFEVTVRSLHEQYVASVRPTVVVLQVAVLLVLLIASVNAPVLVLVRSTRREKELGVRRALGAGRVRLGRQLMAEGGLLAVSAGVLGTGLAISALPPVRELVMARLGQSAPGGLEALAVDGTVVLAAATATAVIGLLFGLVPVVVSRVGSLATVLRAGDRGGPRRGRTRARTAMVILEVALSVALLIGAAAMVRSAVHLQRRDLGFDPEGVMRGVVGLRASSYPLREDRVDFFERLREEVGALPGVQAAGLARTGPFTNRFTPRPYEDPATGVRVEAVARVVSEGYFETLGVRVRSGRGFGPADTPGGEPVVVVSETVARALWPDTDPVGRTLRVLPDAWWGISEPGAAHRVVGVVADAERELGGAGGGDVYSATRQSDALWLNVIARAARGAPPLAPAVEDVLRRLDAQVPLSSVVLLDEVVDEAYAPTRFMAVLLSGFSAFALILAVVGLYGVIAYMARERRRDVAIRMALGADRGVVTRSFLASGLAMTLGGVILGGGGGILLGRSLRGLLHGVGATDPETVIPLLALLFATVSVAIWLPARGAARADPMQVLKEE